MYYNYIKARFYADICTNDTYSILQVSAKVNSYQQIWYRLLYFCEMITIGGRKYDWNVQKDKRAMRGEQYDGIADVQGAVYNEELFIWAEQRQDGILQR